MVLHIFIKNKDNIFLVKIIIGILNMHFSLLPYFLKIKSGAFYLFKKFNLHKTITFKITEKMYLFIM